MDQEESRAARRKKKKKKTKTWKTLAIVLASLAILLVLAAAAAWGFLRYTSRMRAGMFADRSSTAIQDARRLRDAEKKNSGEAAELPEVPEAADEERETLQADWIDKDGTAYRYREDVQSILLMGIDYMADPIHWRGDMVFNGGNADLLALVTLDAETNRLSILYIPRDTMTELLMLDADGNYLDTVVNNISAAHSYGDGGALSCELTAEAVSNLLCGVPISRFAAMDYESISAVNRAIGGLEITFPEDYSSVDYAFQKGVTMRLSDYQLNKLIRYRDHNQLDGAYQRGLRDLKLVLNAMLRQLKKQVKEDPTAALRIYNELLPYMTTNLSADEVSYLAQLVSKVGFDEDTVVHIPGVVTKGEDYAEFYPDEEWLRQYVIDNFCEKLN